MSIFPVDFDNFPKMYGNRTFDNCKFLSQPKNESNISIESLIFINKKYIQIHPFFVL